MNEKELTESRQARISNAWMCVAGVVTITITLLNVPFVSWLTGAPPDGPGTFGDSFGGLTSFFSAASFCLLIYSVILQRRDAAEARQDSMEAIRLAKEELIAAKVEITRNTLPFFIIVYTTGNNRIMMRISNWGAEIYNTVLTANPEIFPPDHYPTFGKEGINHLHDLRRNKEYELKITYTTLEGRRVSETFSIQNGSDIKLFSNRHAVLENIKDDIRGHI